MTSKAEPTAPRSLFGRPFNWIVLALALVAVPIGGYMVDAGMTWNQAHPAVNAMLNGTSAVFLVAGYLAIRRNDRWLHRQCMLAAFTASTLFLASYLTRYAISGTHHYPGTGWDKALYLVILMSHMVLATAVVPMVLRSIYLALHGLDAKHRAIARYTWPIWIYVSVTGVIVYLMLYPIAGAVYGT